MTEEKALLMVAALYEISLGEEPIRVCLGLRFGTKDEVQRLKRLLIKQVQTRYPEIFGGMKPKEVEAKVDFQVYDTAPDRNGFPQPLGHVEWWAV